MSISFNQYRLTPYKLFDIRWSVVVYSVKLIAFNSIHRDNELFVFSLVSQRSWAFVQVANIIISFVFSEMSASDASIPLINFSGARK